MKKGKECESYHSAESCDSMHKSSDWLPDRLRLNDSLRRLLRWHLFLVTVRNMPPRIIRTAAAVFYSLVQSKNTELFPVSKDLSTALSSTCPTLLPVSMDKDLSTALTCSSPKLPVGTSFSFKYIMCHSTPGHFFNKLFNSKLIPHPKSLSSNDSFFFEHPVF